MWDAIEPLQHLPPRTLNLYVREFREDDVLPTDFRTFLDAMCRRAVAPAILTNLLRFRGSSELVGATLTRVRETYEQVSAIAAERPWRFRLAHLARSHPGGVAWRLTFGSWPVMPILDRELIDLLASIPGASLARRHLQDELLRTRFGRLARLPLDRNSSDTEPLLPSRRYRLGRRLGKLRSRFGVKADKERRYYYRMYDFNGPGWTAVRRRAEPYRERLLDLFEPSALARYLPGPEIRMDFRQPIDDAFGPKLLVGLMLWAGDHLQ
jgi:asparagine synthase (glutamine-hydrolysing)